MDTAVYNDRIVNAVGANTNRTVNSARSASARLNAVVAGLAAGNLPRPETIAEISSEFTKFVLHLGELSATVQHASCEKVWDKMSETATRVNSSWD